MTIEIMTKGKRYFAQCDNAKLVYIDRDTVRFLVVTDAGEQDMFDTCFRFMEIDRLEVRPGTHVKVSELSA